LQRYRPIVNLEQSPRGVSARQADRKAEMKLFYSPIHGFIHKVLVVAHEAGLTDRIDRIPTWPMRAEHDITAVNPLSKVPTLALDDGRALYGSQVICEYLDSFNTVAPLFPPSGETRWDALRRLSLADQSFEINVQVTLNRTPEGRATFDWGWPKLMAAFDQMERDAAEYSGFDVGHAGALQTLSYFDRAARQGYEMFDLAETYDWKATRPALAAWYDKAIQRPSVQWHYLVDYEGDVSAANLHAAIASLVGARA
jgi:glutathione S-transferase